MPQLPPQVIRTTLAMAMTTRALDSDTALAAVLERVGDPAYVLDRGSIVLSNAPGARLLGCSREELIGRKWSDVCPEGEASAEVELLGSRGRVAVSLDVEPLSSRRALVVAHLREAGGSRWGGRDVEISTLPSELGVITAHSHEGEPGQKLVGKRCYDALFGRDRPCEGCSALSLARPGAPPSLACVVQPDDRTYVVFGRRAAEDRARLTVYEAPSELLPLLLRSKLAKLGDDANLSPREREVLSLLMLGRSLAEIGAALGITVRTAKYHQANVLAKIGADSRLDLLRLVY